MRRALLGGLGACAATIAACGSNTPAPHPMPQIAISASASSSVAPPTAFVPQGAAPKTDPRIARMLVTVSRTRGLQAKHPVPGVTAARDELLARVRAHVEKEVPHQAIVDEGLGFQLLGVIPAPFDYEKAMYALLEAQLAGYYEPADGTMYMAQDLEDDLADATLSHELVHALQDQYWDLKARSKYAAGQSDLQVATSALAEGDATSTMIDVSLSAMGGAMGAGPRTALDIPGKLFDSVVRSSLASGAAGTGNAPHVMVAGLVAPYVDGTAFVNDLRRRGGWAMVDQAWASPPQSTEQILHVEKWVAHEAPLTVPAPTFAALGAGWSVAQTDTSGELGLRVLAEEWMPHDQAAAIAANWGGDRGVLVKNGDQAAMALRFRWDAATPKDDAYAIAAEGALARTAVKSKDSVPCTARADRGPLAIGRKGRDVVIVAGPAKTGAAAWTSAGDCALARKWIAEILK